MRQVKILVLAILCFSQQAAQVCTMLTGHDASVCIQMSQHTEPALHCTPSPGSSPGSPYASPSRAMV